MTRYVALRLGQRMHKTRFKHVLGAAEDRNGVRRLLCGANSRVARADDNVDTAFDDFGGMVGELLHAQSITVRISEEVLALDKTVPLQALIECDGGRAFPLREA